MQSRDRGDSRKNFRKHAHPVKKWMLCALHVTRIRDIHTLAHTWHSRTRKKWVTFTPLGSEPRISRSRSACLLQRHACERSLCCVASIVRIATCEYRSVQKYFLLSLFSLFRLRPSAQSKAFIISLLRRVPPRREREISILRKLTRKLNRSNFLPSLSASIHHLDHDSRVLEDLYISAIRREITPIITTLPWWIYDMRYLCVIRLLVDRICVTRIIPSRLFLSVSRERK